MTEINIELLLEKFFEGETSCSEESQLNEFFHSVNVPEHLKPYIAMFRWYEDGMPGEPGEGLAETPASSSSLPPRFLMPFMWLSSVAAMIAVILSIGWNYRSSATPAHDMLSKQFEGSFIMVDGNMITDINVIYDEIKAINQEAESIELELRASELSAKADAQEYFS